uniref:Interleukin-3 n=1 Tax=Loxodonta africana TaxID=9785 RepID=G3UC30_LOXAF
MSSLPTLHLLLLLLSLELQAPKAQGMPVTAPQHYSVMINEIKEILQKSPPLNSATPSDTEKTILRDRASLKPNLDAFLKATENFKEKGGSSISKNLRKFHPCLPKAKPQTASIVIQNDWEDFRGKLYPYLETLKAFLMIKSVWFS